MGSAAPAPLTRAAARSAALGRSESRGPRAQDAGRRSQILHRFALCGGAFAGAALVLAIAGFAGGHHPGSPPARSVAENVAVPSPVRAPAVSPSPRASPRVTPSPSDSVVAEAPVATYPETPTAEQAPTAPQPAPPAPSAPAPSGASQATGFS